MIHRNRRSCVEISEEENFFGWKEGSFAYHHFEDVKMEFNETIEDLIILHPSTPKKLNQRKKYLLQSNAKIIVSVMVILAVLCYAALYLFVHYAKKKQK